ncbi:hypothetical protein, partial [Methylorubrum extorquens]
IGQKRTCHTNQRPTKRSVPVLLGALNGCAALRPIDTVRAAEALRRRCPDYRKGMAAIRLANLIDAEGVLRAAAVEPALDAFLKAIEFPRDRIG